MRRDLFRRKKKPIKRWWILACGLLGLLGSFETTQRMLWHLKALWYGQDASCTALQIENTLLHAQLKYPQDVWISSKLERARIQDVLFRNQERWFYTQTSCHQCAVLNAQGLVGLMLNEFGSGMIRPITHRDQLLFVRSANNEKTYLLKGQGSYRPLLVLESEFSDDLSDREEMVYTAGLDSMYPAGLLVGKLTFKNNTAVVYPVFLKKMNAHIYLWSMHDVSTKKPKNSR